MGRRQVGAWVALVLAVAAVALAAWLGSTPGGERGTPAEERGTAAEERGTSVSKPAEERDTPAEERGTSVSKPATVVRITDGDTLDVTLDGARTRLRLLNVDSPELANDGAPAQCLALEARAALAELAPVGATVSLTQYGSDRYGRLLAGLWLADGRLANAELARRGLAGPLVVGGNTALLDPVLDARDEAAASASGLHSPQVACTIAGRLAEARRRLDAASGRDAAALAAARAARSGAQGILTELDADARDAVVQVLSEGVRTRARREAVATRDAAAERVSALEASGVR